MLIQICDAARQHYIGQSCTFRKCIHPQRSHTIRDHHARQTCAVTKSSKIDCGHATRNCHTGQTAAGIKCILTNEQQAIRHHNICQACATTKRRITDHNDAFRNCHTGQTAASIKCIRINSCNAFRNRDIFQHPTSAECMIANGGDACLDNNRENILTQIIPRCIRIIRITRHTATAINAQHTVCIQHPICIYAAAATAYHILLAYQACDIRSHIGMGQRLALRLAADCASHRRPACCIQPFMVTAKRANPVNRVYDLITGARIMHHGLRNIRIQHFDQRPLRFCSLIQNVPNLTESILRLNLSNTIRQRNANKLSASIKCKRIDECNAVRNCNANQLITPRKSTFSNAEDAIRQYNTGKTITMVERAGAYTCNTLRYHDTGQVYAEPKCVFTKIHNAVRDIDLEQTFAFSKSKCTYAFNTLCNRYLLHVVTVTECIITDSCHTAFDHHFFDQLCIGIPRNSVFCIVIQ